jgi:hypothetical protein
MLRCYPRLPFHLVHTVALKDILCRMDLSMKCARP